MKSIMMNKNMMLRVWWVCLLISLSAGIHAQGTQDGLTSLLAQLPGNNAAEEQKVFKELMSSGAANLNSLTAMVVPNGQEAGVKARYAISLLSHTVVDTQQKRQLETLYLEALARATDNEVKAYFLANLKLVGSDQSVSSVKELLSNDALADPALGVLFTVNSEASKQAILSALSGATPALQAKLVKALGALQYKPAAAPVAALATSSDANVHRIALWALARIGDASSSQVLFTQAEQAKFKPEATEATPAIVEYMQQLVTSQQLPVAADVANKVLAGTTEATQQHVRLAALRTLVAADAAKATKVLVAESKRFDEEYQTEVMKLATPTVVPGLKSWTKEYKSATGVHQANMLSLLTSAHAAPAATREKFSDEMVVPALQSKSIQTRMRAAELLTLSRNKKYVEPLLNYLMTSKDAQDITAASTAIGQLASREDGARIARRLSGTDEGHQATLIELLASKRAVEQFDAVRAFTVSTSDSVKRTAYRALPRVSSAANVDALLTLLSSATTDAQVSDVQAALIASVDESSAPRVLAAYEKQPLRVIPVLPYTPGKNALATVLAAFHSGNAGQKQAAFQALTNWPNETSVRPLLDILKDPSLQSYHASAGESILSRVVKSELPDDQKLLLVREVMTHATDNKQKNAALRAAGGIRTFLSLMFVSAYLDDPALTAVASRSAMTIALPASDGRPGLAGVEVRKVLNKMADRLTGADSQYEKIDIVTYLEKMPHEIGYESIFNGKDLSGWHGLVGDPIKRSKMTPAELAKKQKEADAAVSKNWNVKDGMIVFQGDGANLCTIRKYGDFEMVVDWKISKNGDSGIYLRGSPQVQIWDTTRRDVGAQVGSGGLYNNQKNRSTPLSVADNPIGEWNTFRIQMIGEKVTVHLNGVLVVDNVVLENYWDRGLPIFPEEAIELQAHGTDLAFRNIYVKEINPKPYLISGEEQKAGFKPLFDGKTLDNWVGNKTDYVVEGNTIALYPGEKSHGNLYSEKEYSDFTLRFEFQLTPGANNGLGIHAPLEGDAAYVGKEIQILDNTSPQYAQLQPYQYHGSVYGILAAKRDFLKPVGEWNEEEVYVKGDFIRVTLNGTVIVEGDLRKATANGTADHKDHPGLKRHTGHIGFLGHGSIVRFRNLRINELK